MRRLALATGMLGLALSTAGAAEKPRLHPLEKYCAWYEQTGMQSGQIQECSREYGWERFEKRSLVTQVGPMRQEQRDRVVFRGDTITTIDLTAGTATRARNPQYAEMVKLAEGRDPDELTRQMLASLGAQETGESKQIAGQSCRVYSMMGGTLCLHERGLMLEHRMGGIVRRATKLSIGSGGDDADYRVPEGMAVTERELPDSGAPPAGSARGGAPPGGAPGMPEDVRKMLEQMQTQQGR